MFCQTSERHHGIRKITSGAETILFARQQHFDLLITDFGMAEQNGAGVIRQIREIDPDYKVTVLSGWPMSRIGDRFHADAQPDAVLTKSVTLSSLQTLIVQRSEITSSMDTT